MLMLRSSKKDTIKDIKYKEEEEYGAINIDSNKANYFYTKSKLIGIFIFLLIGTYLYWINDELEIPNPTEDAYGFYNGNILTYTKEGVKYYDSMVIIDGKFDYIGDYETLIKKYKNIQLYNLKGYVIQPGLIDAHAHVLGRGRQKLQVDLTNINSISKIKNKIQDHIKENKEKKYIEGFGWDQNLFDNKKFPSFKDLEFKHNKNVLIHLNRIDFHASWVNKNLLDLITAKMPEIIKQEYKIDGGSILRDKKGYPTGVFLDNARDLVYKVIPKLTELDELNALNSATKEMLLYGLTSVHDAGINPNELVYSMIICPELATYCDEQSLKSIGVPEMDYLNKQQLSIKSIKVVLDGALGSWGAAMLEPYSDKNTTGLILYDIDILREKMKVWSKMGLQINSHAIGDKANRVALDNYEYLIKNNIVTKQQLKQQRHRIEHAQILTAADIPRFAKLGIIPSMQPTHATSDMKYAESRLGKQRLEYAYTWKTLLNSGIQALPLSSDFPVEHVDPRLSIYAAVTRLDTKGDSPHGSKGWYFKEKLSKLEALKGLTIDAAFSAFKENEIGSIEVGKLADFIIVKKSWLDIPADELLSSKSKVKATYLGGKKVFS